VTTTAAILLIVATFSAAADWWAVHRRDDRLESIAKPVVMLALIGAAVTVDPVSNAMRWWFVAALVLCLIGDVALLPRLDAFVVGLGSFLLAHVAYVIGMLPYVDSWPLALVAVVIVAADLIVVGRPVLEGTPAPLRIPVAVYFGAISALLIVAYATGSYALAAGALLFLASDSLLAWGRFVEPAPGGRLAVHVTYHLAQAVLVIGLS
jgi:alkenylglycerophosphocholine/alkenylglycerophosphoethanolamine hydrolase